MLLYVVVTPRYFKFNFEDPIDHTSLMAWGSVTNHEMAVLTLFGNCQFGLDRAFRHSLYSPLMTA